MNIVKLNIQNGADREAMIISLANNGYKVWVEKEEMTIPTRTNYYVYFLIKES